MEGRLYFAYGSNMNLGQMEYRCPNAEAVGNALLHGYRLAFRGRPRGNGVASILPEPGSQVEGVLWKITPECEQSLDRYEGYPDLYGKQTVTVRDAQGTGQDVAVYIMNEPYQSCPADPSAYYLEGILQGCRQNGIQPDSVMEALERTRREIENGKPKEGPGRNTRKRPRNPER